MGCLKVIVRNLVGLLAFTKWLIGISILSFCLWTIATASKLEALVNGRSPATYFLLAAGLIFLLDGTIGWAGVSKRNRVLLKLFLILSFFIFVAEIGILLTLSIFKTNSTQVADQLWAEANPRVQFLVQEQLVCCGLNSSHDYESSRDIDASCYHRDLPLSSNTIDGPDNLLFTRVESPPPPAANSQQLSKTVMNTEGCRQRMLEFAHDNRLWVLLAAAAFMAYQMITMLLTASVISLTRRKSLAGGRHHMDSLEELDQSSGSGIHHNHGQHLTAHHGHHAHGPTYM